MIAYYNNDTGELRLFLDTEGEDLSNMTEVDFPEDYNPQLYYWDTDVLDFIKDCSKLDYDLHRQIDLQAGNIRRQFITDVTGQQDTYRIKEKEARSWTSESNPNDFPFLKSESQVRSISIDEMAELIIEASNEWQEKAAKIEAARIKAKIDVTAAKDIESKLAAAEISWTE